MPQLTHYKAGGNLFEELIKSVDKGRADELLKGYDLKTFYAIFDDGDLLSSCFCLFDNDLNVSRTARKLYMHRNTLIYRLNKIKRLTGLNLCRLPDAITFMFIYECTDGVEERK